MIADTLKVDHIFSYSPSKKERNDAIGWLIIYQKFKNECEIKTGNERIIIKIWRYYQWPLLLENNAIEIIYKCVCADCRNAMENKSREWIEPVSSIIIIKHTFTAHTVREMLANWCIKANAWTMQYYEIYFECLAWAQAQACVFSCHYMTTKELTESLIYGRDGSRDRECGWHAKKSVPALAATYDQRMINTETCYIRSLYKYF